MREHVYGAEYFFKEDRGDLARDLKIVEWVNQKLNDRLPVTYNYYLQGGYLNMPSARMGKEGEIAFGVSFVPPYRNYSARCQLFSHIELTGCYRIFTGIDDPVLGHSGFGEFSDKGANIKWSILLPEDSDYALPGVAIGYDDFLGTQSFKSKYIVATQVFQRYDLEVSLGYGVERINRWFGGAIWMPFRHSGSCYLRGLGFVVEYDGIDYPHDPHPEARNVSSHINAGLKYRLFDYFDFSCSSVRGREFACAASVYYNFGSTKGFLPKIDDPLPYCTPINTQPIGYLRPEDALIQDLLYPLRAQGFELLQAWISFNDCGQKVLRLRVYNTKFRTEDEVRRRFDYLFAALIPSDVDYVIAALESEGFPIQEYRYCMPLVRCFADRQVGEKELNLFTPRREVSYGDPGCSRLLFKQHRERVYYDLLPKTQTFFGSSTGKFKYAIGVGAGIHGFLWDDIYYQALFGYTFFSSIGNIQDTDRLNPSQLINVKTCLPNYYKRSGLTIDKFFFQKCWNMGKGFYSRFGTGYFDLAYGGFVGEFLYYPANSCWAVGIEGATLRKRTLHGFGFTNKIRKLNGFIPSFVPFHGSQYFLDLYYDWEMAQLDFKVSIGKFLANDTGVRYEVTRYFSSGLRISFWYTTTNAHDMINGKVYYDKGFSFSMPLDIFYTESSRERWGYGMSAWLRDCGYRTGTGRRLYELIQDQRIK